jgi:hypothetical protein
VEFELYPEGSETVREDPEGTLARAMELALRTDRALNHVFFAALVLHREDPARAVRLLVEALSSPSPGLRETALATLRLLTGRRDLEDAEDWEGFLILEYP